MGICRLDASLDPRVAPFLQREKLDWLPEAHSYCCYKGQRFDITFPEQEPVMKPLILKEYELGPSDLGARKEQLHGDYIERWLDSMGRKESLESVWRLREEWIAFLGESTPGPE